MPSLSDDHLLEILPVDISPFRQGTGGTEYSTTLDSGKPGPHVMITALTHGNELCGAHALRWLFERDFRPRQGRLTLSFANWEAYLSFDRNDPFASRFLDEDLNRVWTEERLNGGKDHPLPSRELKRARELLPLISSADFLLDIHSMHLFSPPMLLAGMQPRALELSLGLGLPEYVVMDPGHAAGRRMRDHGGFDDPQGSRTAILAECGQHWSRDSVETAIKIMTRFLEETGMAAPGSFDDLAQGEAREPAPPQKVLQVSRVITINNDDFHFTRELNSMDIIREQGTLVALDGREEIRTPHPDCYMIMPGWNLRKGQTAVRFGRLVTPG
ncbi:MAG: succinylglutamate desuccinylase/aspartoacylase family protein [Deltaproteobacteria bacterium]|nr:succinylglutamate desuccinylase/aspartoacylase family protein [Deltaproteobacteria bacterium]